jgi:hypothetical protein
MESTTTDMADRWAKNQRAETNERVAAVATGRSVTIFVETAKASDRAEAALEARSSGTWSKMSFTSTILTSKKIQPNELKMTVENSLA